MSCIADRELGPAHEPELSGGAGGAAAGAAHLLPARHAAAVRG